MRYFLISQGYWPLWLTLQAFGVSPWVAVLLPAVVVSLALRLAWVLEFSANKPGEQP